MPIATITVTYNPSLVDLERQLRALPADSTKVVVDNASALSQWQEITEFSASLKNLYSIRNEYNVGLAKAINMGVDLLADMIPRPEFVLLLDQDTEPREGSIEALVGTFRELRAAGHKVGCVGPLLVDPRTNLTHGFHQATWWRWKRVYPPYKNSSPVNSSSINGSGSLVPIDVFRRMGGLEESLFIDHVDTEWSFRLKASGYSLWGVPKAEFVHKMGEAGARYWLFGWRVWPVRVPRRHYFLFRNAVMLMRRPYVPRVWKFWAVAKLTLTASIVLIAGPSRSSQIGNMVEGLKEGIQSHVATE